MVRVIDNVLESISFGLEQNDFRFSQRRVAEVKYLGELYNYRMLEHPVIFDTMYKIVLFGYSKIPFSYWYNLASFVYNLIFLLDGPPVLGKYNPFDLADDYFRIRLVSIMLETCGMFFNRGAAGKKLDYFLSFFQVRRVE